MATKVFTMAPNLTRGFFKNRGTESIMIAPVSMMLLTGLLGLLIAKSFEACGRRCSLLLTFVSCRCLFAIADFDTIFNAEAVVA